MAQNAAAELKMAEPRREVEDHPRTHPLWPTTAGFPGHNKPGTLKVINLGCGEKVRMAVLPLTVSYLRMLELQVSVLFNGYSIHANG